MYIDLHTHTCISDGRLTPKELVLRAEQMQIAYLSITDHDAVIGNRLAEQARQDMGIRSLQLISGIEVSCRWHQQDIHILGWNFNLEHSAITTLVAKQQEKRHERALEMAARLSKQGVVPQHLPVVDEASNLTRYHFAAALLEHGYVSTWEQAFKRYLGRGACAYVATDWCDIGEAVGAIQEAGGDAGLAHPHAYQLKGKWLKRLLATFVEAKGDALEVAIGQQSPQQRKELADLAQSHQLYASVGSDFHYPGRWRELGRHLELPASCQPIWSKWALASYEQEEP